MALYEHNNHDDIHYFSSIKMFHELVEGDYVYLLNIETLEIKESKVRNLKIEDKTETVTEYNLVQEKPVYTDYKYHSVHFDIDEINYTINIQWGTETNIIERNRQECSTWNVVICTTKREAEQLQRIITAKCNIQMNTFKRMFNGCGWNYAKETIRLS